jgi:hypothetical protein
MRVQMYFASWNIAAMTSGVMPSRNNCQKTSTLPGISCAPDAHRMSSRVRFDYLMKPGPVTRSNALALMHAVGLDVPGAVP